MGPEHLLNKRKKSVMSKEGSSGGDYCRLVSDQEREGPRHYERRGIYSRFWGPMCQGRTGGDFARMPYMRAFDVGGGYR